MLVNMTALGLKHSRKIYTEEHTKIFAAVWGDRIYFILFSCRVSYFAPGRFEE